MLNNAINIKLFKFDEKIRNSERNEFNCTEDDILVGHIGRFHEQKNHKFLLEIFSEIFKLNSHTKLFIVGDGAYNGMHTAHNTAYDFIYTELNVCIDSDDILPQNAISIIHDIWNEIREKNYAGIIGLDADFNGNVLGTEFENEGIETTLHGFYDRGGRGDKKLVYRTDLMKKYPPYPEFEGEKLVPLSYKYFLCDQEYFLYATNKVLCNVEYQEEGSTQNMWRQRLKNARGFAFYKKVRMQYPTTKKKLIIDCIHYTSSSLICGNKFFIRESPCKLMTVLVIPFGFALKVFIKWKAKP